MTKRRARTITTDAAIAQADVYDGYRPKAVSAIYREEDDAVAMTLACGIEIAIPRKLLRGLEEATSAQLREVQIDERACTSSQCLLRSETAVRMSNRLRESCAA